METPRLSLEVVKRVIQIATIFHAKESAENIASRYVALLRMCGLDESVVGEIVDEVRMQSQTWVERCGPSPREQENERRRLELEERAREARMADCRDWPPEPVNENETAVGLV